MATVVRSERFNSCAGSIPAASTLHRGFPGGARPWVGHRAGCGRRSHPNAPGVVARSRAAGTLARGSSCGAAECGEEFLVAAFFVAWCFFFGVALCSAGEDRLCWFDDEEEDGGGDRDELDQRSDE